MRSIWREQCDVVFQCETHGTNAQGGNESGGRQAMCRLPGYLCKRGNCFHCAFALTRRQMLYAYRHSLQDCSKIPVCYTESNVNSSITTEKMEMCKMCACWVLRQLTDDLKMSHIFTRCNLEGESSLDRVVTGDKTWVHHSTPPTRPQITNKLCV